MADLPGGPDTFWQQVQASRARYIKWLWPDHQRAELQSAKDRGCKNIIRVPGQAVVYASDIREMLAHLAGVADVFECGNEPDAEGEDALWRHAFYMEHIAVNIKPDANRMGIRLCTPGWTGNAAPPIPNTDLGRRLVEVYKRFDGVGIHAYGEHVLEGPQIKRIQTWASTFSGQPLLGTEGGIAAKDLVSLPPSPGRYPVSEMMKAERYARFTTMLALEVPSVICMAYFIANVPTREWCSFSVAGEYDPLGHRGFCLSLEAWRRYGDWIGQWS